MSKFNPRDPRPHAGEVADVLEEQDAIDMVCDLVHDTVDDIARRVEQITATRPDLGWPECPKLPGELDAEHQDRTEKLRELWREQAAVALLVEITARSQEGRAGRALWLGATRDQLGTTITDSRASADRRSSDRRVESLVTWLRECHDEIVIVARDLDAHLGEFTDTGGLDRLRGVLSRSVQIEALIHAEDQLPQHNQDRPGTAHWMGMHSLVTTLQDVIAAAQPDTDTARQLAKKVTALGQARDALPTADENMLGDGDVLRAHDAPEEPTS